MKCETDDKCARCNQPIFFCSGCNARFCRFEPAGYSCRHRCADQSIDWDARPVKLSA